MLPLQQNVIDEISLAQGGTYTRTVYSSGTGPLKVTICWTDPAGTPVAAQLDPTDAMLVNDLDLRLAKSGTTYYPLFNSFFEKTVLIIKSKYKVFFINHIKQWLIVKRNPMNLYISDHFKRFFPRLDNIF